LKARSHTDTFVSASFGAVQRGLFSTDGTPAVLFGEADTMKWSVASVFLKILESRPGQQR